jgi:prepilin-type N-terminal cleavage/methylation domain-containing protein
MKSNRNNKVKKVRGFTLIELLVVIAIIGILSSVVLASVNIARAKGADTAAKSNITNIRAQAELVYDNNSGFYNNILTGNTVCNDSNVVAGLSGAAEKEGFTWTSISDNSAERGH